MSRESDGKILSEGMLNEGGEGNKFLKSCKKIRILLSIVPYPCKRVNAI